MTPHEDLVAVLQSLAADLPREFPTLLAHPRFAEGAAALQRLADPAYAASIECPDEEASWLADALTTRRARL